MHGGGGVTGGGITRGGSIDVVNGVNCRIWGGCSGCGYSESRGNEQGSQFENSSCSLVIAVS